MMWLFLLIILVNRMAVVVIAADDAQEESWNLWKDNHAKKFIDNVYHRFNVSSDDYNWYYNRIKSLKKRNQHFYFSIDRAAVYVLLMILLIFATNHLQPWQIAIITAMDLGINLGWFKFWHDGLTKLFYNIFDPTVYKERFWADSDNQSDASTDKWFADTAFWRTVYLALSVVFTIIQIALYISWA